MKQNGVKYRGIWKAENREVIVTVNHRRRIGLLLLCMLVVCGLAGCKRNVGTPEDNAVKTNEETKEEKKADEEEEAVKEEGHLLGFTAVDMENPYYVTLEASTRQVVEEAGCRMITKNPASDAKLQAQQIEEMIEEGVEVIFLAPVNWEEITPSLEALKQANIKIINIDTQVKESAYVDAYIGSDNKKAGYICGEDLIEKCPEGGKIAILESPSQNSVNERMTGFEEAIAKAEKGFEVVAREDTGGKLERALEAVQQILKDHEDIKAIMCGNDQMAVAAKTAANLTGRTDILIYGVDGSPDIKKELKKPDSQVAGTAAQSPINMGQKAAQTAIKIIEGETYEKEVYEDVFLINRGNVEMYGADGWQ